MIHEKGARKSAFFVGLNLLASVGLNLFARIAPTTEAGARSCRAPRG
jgi:hypothetical protein